MTAFYSQPHKACLLLISMIVLFSCKEKPRHVGYDAKDALSTFKIAEGFKIEMIASEPLISDPVDMEIDEFGRMYVVEMHGYPLDKSGSGKIIQLTDTDGDGKMDKRTVFKESLVLPNSVMRWKKGLLVTDSPAILYLEDSNDDGVADKTDTIITGFALTNPQHNANNPVYGLDNWIYVAHESEVSTRSYKEEFGDTGRAIVFAADTNAVSLPRNANGRSIRFRPEQKKLEMLSSRCQYGHNFDAWGRLFECDNSNHSIQEVIAERYFNRNHDLVISNATQSLSNHLNAAEVFPITTNPDRQLLTDVGVMTSACAITPYLGGAFSGAFQHATFVAEPVSNLVHADVLLDSNSSFSAGRVLQQQEFLASTDAWSRPVNFYVGPDGALYVLDYYRKVIESPEWMSDEAIDAGGLYDGYDKGRIFRITPADGSAGNFSHDVQLGKASIAELVDQLSNPNYWWRINAQRLLVDKADRNSVPLLEKKAGDSTAFGRLHAMWTLEGLNALNDSLIVAALNDRVPELRENAIRLAELHLAKNPSLVKTIIGLQNDENAKVRFQALLTLGFIDDANAASARNNILFRDIKDKWVQVAALSASSSQSLPLLSAVLSRYNEQEPAYGSLIERLTTMIGHRGESSAVSSLIKQSLASPSKKYSFVINGLANGTRNSDTNLNIDKTIQSQLVNTFFTTNVAEMRGATLAFLKANNITDSVLRSSSLQRARKQMQDSSLAVDVRADIIDFIAFTGPASFESDLKKLINPKEEPRIQLAALRALNAIKGTGVSELVINNWGELTPEIRSASIETFVEDSARVAMLIDALEKNKIQASAVDFGTSVQLMQNDNENLRTRARQIFTKNEREREKVNKDYKDALQLEGDPVKGKQVYVSNCAICHQVRGKSGVAIGPDLGTVHNWTKEDVLANILNPNMSIASGFDTWSVTTKGGEKVQGIIVTETPVAITLRNNGQLDRTINRQEIESLKSVNSSAMPTELEKNINKQQMADLLAFLRRNQDFK